MAAENYGGNSVKRLHLGKPGKELLGSGPYEYFLYEAAGGDRVSFEGLGSYSVYVLHKPVGARIRSAGLAHEPEQGDRVQVEGQPIEFAISGGAVRLLVAGTEAAHPDRRGIELTRHADLYKVSKPWGHELWINGQHPCYALKEIFIKAGTKTSFQYHNFKQETNVLFEGTANLHFKNDPGVPNDQVTPAATGIARIDPVSSIDVMPRTLHRLEALTDILLYETSTPHLDDVIRVSDDSRRPDGRLEREHRT